MKILIYLYCFPGVRGTEKVTSFLANSLSMENEVWVMSHCAVAVYGSSFPVDSKVKVLHTPSRRFYSSANKAFIQRRIREFMPDVIIFQDSTAPIGHNLFVGDMKVPVIVCAHTAAYRYYARPNFELGVLRGLCELIMFPLIRELKYIRDRVRRRRIYERCWRYVLLSSRMFGEFRAVSRIGDSQKLRAIPNPELGSGVGILSVTLNAVKINEIVFVGAHNYGKGVDFLLEAWSLIGAQSESWKLVVVGDGPARRKLERFAERKNLNNVVFKGWQTNARSYFERAKILSFPSRNEGWPLVITEAMSCGCVPVIMDSFSSAREIVDDGVNGFVVPAFDIDCYAKKLQELMQRTDLLDRMSLNAQEKARQYAPEHVLQKWKSLLGELDGNR